MPPPFARALAAAVVTARTRSKGIYSNPGPYDTDQNRFVSAPCWTRSCVETWSTQSYTGMTHRCASNTIIRRYSYVQQKQCHYEYDTWYLI